MFRITPLITPLLIVALWSSFAASASAGEHLDRLEGFYRITAARSNDGGSAKLKQIGNYVYVGNKLSYRIPGGRGVQIKTLPPELVDRVPYGVERETVGIFSLQGSLVTHPNDPSRLYWSMRDPKKPGRNLRRRAELAFPGDCVELTLFEKRGTERATFELTPLGRDIEEVNALTGFRVPETRYFAHRGSAYLRLSQNQAVFPTNTRGAILDSLTQGFHGVEIDLRLTKDRRWIISHDDRLAAGTNCAGRVRNKLLADVLRCDVTRSAAFPDMGIFSSRARVPQRMWTPKELLDEFGSDPRMERIVLDVKPSKSGDEGALITELLRPYPRSVLSKITILIRSAEDEKKIKENLSGDSDLPFAATIAIEGSKGYELINLVDRKAKPGSEADAARRLAEQIAAAGDGGGLSISVGIGLAFGSKEKPGQRLVGAVGELFRGLGHWIREGFDIGNFKWSAKRAAAMKTVVAEADRQNKKILAWTVNSISKIEELRRIAPTIDGVLTDLPYTEIARVQMNELEAALGTTPPTMTERATRAFEDVDLNPLR